jgi:DNA helicase-2/ATP-dependent DNA helicase PcrA
LTWIPFLQRDIEGLAYFEAIVRTMEDNILFSTYKSQILVDSQIPYNNIQNASINQAYWNIFVPIAMGVIEIEEDLFETLPHDRLNIMSIHQAKGLEFPIVIVDVGSEFLIRHRKQAFKRFPAEPSFDTIIESELRPFSPLTTELELNYSERDDISRDFDDLIRKFFVAYSRPKDLLLLVGLNSVRDGYQVGAQKRREDRQIENIATGWDRTGQWIWGPGLTNLTHI